ncbi:MAG TPA: hypothetical protein VGG74_04025 [Kofleriaceae bacterium]
MAVELRTLLEALESTAPSERLDAATRLRDESPPFADALSALVAHLDDTGQVDEDWTDWDGSVIGGTTYRVADRVIEALVRLGTPAFLAVLAAVERGKPATALRQLVAILPMDALVNAGPDAVARTRHATELDATSNTVGTSPLEAAARALAWADRELSSAEDRIDVLAQRLLFTGGKTDTLAAEELGKVAAPGNQRTATLLARALLHEPRPELFALQATAASLDALGPVLDPATAAQLIAIAPTRAMFYCWPQLLPAVASYGELAASLGPWLLSWVRDDVSQIQIGKEHHADVRKSAALAIARSGEVARPLHDELAEIYFAGPNNRRELVLQALPDRSVLVGRLGARWRQTLAGSDRDAIEETLGMIDGVGAAAAPLVDAIVPFAQGSRGYWYATLTLGELGEAARPFVPVLIRALNDPLLSSWACMSLRKLGPSIVGEDAIGPLEEIAARDRATGALNSSARDALEVLRPRSFSAK